MIVREIEANPDRVLKNFDWFNDYKDTRSWCIGGGLTELVDRLDEGNKKYWAERDKRFCAHDERGWQPN